ncbi:unnamed protein product [Polarella glacialis]|uniref:Uncharacterized protein n=1 Tax=Polarella glacialis TaxID=89957 RepID=A0A813LCV2_POLGL|nr:unnamed protein product [Polarella glacialis]
MASGPSIASGPGAWLQDLGFSGSRRDAATLTLEECGPGLLVALGEHAGTLTWLVSLALTPQLQRTHYGESALRGLLHRFGALQGTFASTEALGDRHHSQLLVARGQAEAEAVARRGTEAAMGSELQKLHRALAAERNGRESLLREAANMQEELRFVAGAAKQANGQLAERRTGQEDDRQTAMVASLELARTREAAAASHAQQRRLEAEIAELRRIIEGRDLQVCELRGALVAAGGNSKLAAKLAAEREGELALSWRKRAEEVELTAVDRGRQALQAQARWEAARTELRLIESLLTCAAGIPPGVLPDARRQKGSWRLPGEGTCGKDERKALALAQRAEAIFREHVVHGRQVGPASRGALRQAIGVEESEVLLMEFQVGDHGRPQAPFTSQVRAASTYSGWMPGD